MEIVKATKVSPLSFLYCLILILYAGLATRFTRDLGNITTLGNAVGLIFSFIVVINHRLAPDNKLGKTLLVFIIYALITTINNGRFSLLWISKWTIFFWMAYVLCKDLKDRLFYTIEICITLLCIISLVFWIIQVINPSAIYNIVKSFEFSTPYDEEARIEGNMIVFTLISNFRETELFGIFPRNSGFAWEPGAFGSYICLGIFCNILRKDFSFKHNYPLYIMLFTLLTTQSTTALAAFAVAVVIWLFIKRKIGYAIVLIPLIVWIYSLPFVSDKALLEYENAVNFSLEQIDVNRDLSRMQSFFISWNEFLHHPILGLGGDAGGSWLIEQGYDMAIFSGIGELLSRYGLIITIVFFTELVKSSKTISILFNNKAAFCLIGIMVAIMIGFNNWNQPIFIAFWLYSQFGVLEQSLPLKESCQS